MSSALEHPPRPKTIRGVQFTAATTMAARIAASQHFNNAWTPRADLAATANRIRNMFLRLDRAHPSKCEVTLLIERNPSRPSFVSDFAGDLRRVFEDLRERLSVAISNKQIQSMFAAEPGL